jgi:hypothetical protein
MEEAARRIRVSARVRMTADRFSHALLGECPADAQARPAWVAAALTRQLELYGRLDQLSLRQGALIDDDDTDRLLAVLGERQVVVDEVAEIGTRLEPVRQDWDGFLHGLPAPTREQLRHLVSTLTDLAGIVAGRDEADRRRLELRRSEVGEELASVTRGRSAVRAYGGRGSPVPIFQDREV